MHSTTKLKSQICDFSSKTYNNSQAMVKSQICDMYEIDQLIIQNVQLPIKCVVAMDI